MTSIEKKLDELREWGKQEKRPPLPAHLLPNYSDIEALLYKETPAMLYFSQLFSQLFSDLVEEMHGMAEEIKQLRKQVEGKS